MLSVDDLPPPQSIGLDDLPPPPDKSPGYLKQLGRGAVDSLPMIGGVVGGVLGTPADVVAGPFGNVAGAALGGAAGESVKNFINSYVDPERAPKNLTDAFKATAGAGAEQATMQGVGEAATPILSKAVETVAPYASKVSDKIGDAASWAKNKIISNLGGVHPDVIKEYLGSADRINSAPSPEELKEISDNFVGKLAQDVEDKKISLAQANQVLDAHKQQIGAQFGEDARNATTDLDQARSNYRDLVDTTKREEQQKTFDTKKALSDAQNTLDRDHAAYIQTLKDQGAPMQLAPQTVDAVSQLQKNISDASSKAFDTLKNNPASMPKDALLDTIDSHIQNQMIQGKAPVGGQAEEAVNSLGKLRDQIDGLGENLSMPDLKKIVQNLDKDINWKGGAGQYTDAASSEKMGIRGSIDKYLKTNVPEYRQMMEPVAIDAELLSKVAPQYGTDAKAYSRLASIANKSPADQELLYRLGEATGNDFKAPVMQHLNAKSLLDDPLALEQMRQSHPAYEKIQNLQAELKNRSQPGFIEDRIKTALDGSTQDAARTSAEERVNQFTPQARAENARGLNPDEYGPLRAPAQSVRDSQAAFDQAKESLAPFKPLAANAAGQTQAQQKLLQLGKGKNIELEDMFKKLGSMTDTDFAQAMKDQKTLEQFKKAAVNGSRNTVSGAVAGWLLGGEHGALMGLGVGRAIDQYGPTVTKKILDASLKISKNPSADAISRLDIPPEAKKQMLVGLQNFIASGGKNASQSLPKVADKNNVNRSPAQGEDKWAQNGVQKLGIDNETAQQLLSDPRTKSLLIQASDLPPGSKAMQNIKNQIMKGMGRK